MKGCPGAYADSAIATDFYKPFVGHPGFPREEFMTEIHKRFSYSQRARTVSGRALALLDDGKDNLNVGAQPMATANWI